MVGVKKAELETENSLIDQYMSKLNELVKSLERDQDLLRMVIDSSPVSGARKDLLRMADVGGRDAAFDCARKTLMDWPWRKAKVSEVIFERKRGDKRLE